MRVWQTQRRACITARKLNSQNQSCEAFSSALGVSLRLLNQNITAQLPQVYDYESGVLYAHARFETEKGPL